MSNSNNFWTADRLSLLKKKYPSETNDTLAEELGVSVSYIKKKAHELGLKKTALNRKKVTPDMRESILRAYKTYSYRDISKMFNLSVPTLMKVVNDAVANDGYEGKTMEDINKIRSTKRINLLKKERTLATFGLEAISKLKIWPNRKKWRIRAQLKHCGYYVERNSSEAFAYFDIKRHQRLEQLAEENGISVSEIDFEPLAPEEVCENGEAEIEIAHEQGIL